MPGADCKTLLDVQRGKFDDPPYSLFFRENSSRSVTLRDLGTDVDEIDCVCALEGAAHGSRFSEVAQKYIHALAEKRSCFAFITDQHPRTNVAFQQSSYDPRADIPCCACDQMLHFILDSISTCSRSSHRDSLRA